MISFSPTVTLGGGCPFLQMRKWSLQLTSLTQGHWLASQRGGLEPRAVRFPSAHVDGCRTQLALQGDESPEGTQREHPGSPPLASALAGPGQGQSVRASPVEWQDGTSPRGACSLGPRPRGRCQPYRKHHLRTSGRPALPAAARGLLLPVLLWGHHSASRVPAIWSRKTV